MNYHIEELLNIDLRITMLTSILRPFLSASIPIGPGYEREKMR
jgi:hypothetical protein